MEWAQKSPAEIIADINQLMKTWDKYAVRDHDWQVIVPREKMRYFLILWAKSGIMNTWEVWAQLYNMGYRGEELNGWLRTHPTPRFPRPKAIPVGVTMRDSTHHHMQIRLPDGSVATGADLQPGRVYTVDMPTGIVEATPRWMR